MAEIVDINKGIVFRTDLKQSIGLHIAIKRRSYKSILFVTRVQSLFR